MLVSGGMTASRDSVRSFTATEEEFFQAGERSEPTQPVETFADLEEGGKPLTLWQRLFGKKR